MLLNIGAVYLDRGWVYMQKFQSVWVPSREGIKDGRQQ